LEFKFAFTPTVEIQPGKTCCWADHFDGVAREVIWYLDAQARRWPIDRFTYVFVKTMVAGINKNRARLGLKPYAEVSIHKAIAYLKDLGIIVSVSRMKFKGQIRHGYLVARHDDACDLVGNECQFMGGGDSGLMIVVRPNGGDKP
jgi:hypothetical protein